MSKTSKQVSHRSAETGRFVTERYATTHPKTTVRETNPRSTPQPAKKK